jgi:hypothetical protein
MAIKTKLREPADLTKSKCVPPAARARGPLLSVFGTTMISSAKPKFIAGLAVAAPAPRFAL